MSFFRKKENFQKNNIVRESKKDRLDVLLVYPIWVTQAGRGRLQRMLPPLGVLSIASYLESKGYEVQIIDLHSEAITPEQFRVLVKKLKPRFVGITVLSSHYIPANYVATICREEVADCKVYVGGVHAEAYPEQMLRNPNIEAVGRGDGEEVMLDLVQGKPYETIKGLSYRGPNGTVIHNLPREVETELDKYPFPAYHLIDFDNYFPAVGTYKNFPAINALMTRGCPGKCTFCNSAKTTLRGRSPEKMVELIKMLRNVYGIRQITFYDDTFTANPKNVRAFCKKLIEDKVDITFVCYARGDMFSDEMAALLAKAGCHHVLLGIESGSASLMAKIGKPIEKEKYKKVVETAHKNDIEVRGAFIIGHLDETRETLEETLQFAKDLNLDFFQPSILTPYPGTQLYKQAKADGLLNHENFDRYGQGEVILKMKNLTSKEVLKFYYWCFFRYYFRPKAVWQQFKRLRNLRQLRDLMKTFYIILIEGLQKDKSNDLRGWLNFDIEKIADKSIRVPDTPRLTWEVRQSDYFS